MVEVNKEFDSNASHLYPDFDDPYLLGYGTDGNFGQPSVVYEVPLHIDVNAAAVDAQASLQITGYGDWAGATGVINPRDATISTTSPGSGEGRLLPLSNAKGTLSGRVLASVGPCSTVVCDPNNVCSACDPTQPGCVQVQCSPLPAPPSAVTGLGVQTGGLTGNTAAFQFVNADSNGTPVMKYDVRYQTGSTITDAEFGSAPSAQQVMPGAPGTLASFSIRNLKPSTDYVVAIRAIDPCGQVSPIVSLPFTTTATAFTKLSGCFIATAAWGSALAPDVAAMRQVRDRLRPASTMFAVATDLYYSTGPAAAEVLKRSGTARALVRRLLAPVGAASRAAVALAQTR